MRLGRIELMRLLINCRIRHCWYCCPVPWAATQPSRTAKRDVIGYNNFASWIDIVNISGIMLMRLQELCKSCRAFCYFIYFILLQMGEPLKGRRDTVQQGSYK